MSLAELNKNLIQIKGNATFEVPNQPIKKVIFFVETHLPEFSNRFSNSNIRNERGLTQKLLRLLGNKLSDEYPFFFDKEGMEDESKGNSPAVDFDVITKDRISIQAIMFDKEERFFAFEAKILGIADVLREKEYVMGHFKTEHGKKKYIECGGIERFKTGKHGQNLPYAGMIGYVIKENFEFWHRKINLWIDELMIDLINARLQWKEEDKLIHLPTNSDLIAKCSSLNCRFNENEMIPPINIIHLWINLIPRDK